MYLMSNCPSPLLGAPGSSSSAVKARVDCMVRYRLLGPLEVESEAGRVDIGPPKRPGCARGPAPGPGPRGLRRPPGRSGLGGRRTRAVIRESAGPRLDAAEDAAGPTRCRSWDCAPSARLLPRPRPRADRLDSLRGRLPFLQIRHHGRALALSPRRNSHSGCGAGRCLTTLATGSGSAQRPPGSTSCTVSAGRTTSRRYWR